MQICNSVNLFQGVGFKPGGDMHAPYIEVVLCPLLFVEYNAVGYNSLFCEVKIQCFDAVGWAAGRASGL